MRSRPGFDNEKYIEEQTREILDRVGRFNDKLYLEIGGKIMYDYHASRVLPGFDPNVKMRMLQKLRDRVEVIMCVFAGDIEKKKIRADFGITYDVDSLKTIDDFREWGIEVRKVVITRYTGQYAANVYRNKLERRGIEVYTHSPTLGYPSDIDKIVSDEGYGANVYIPVSKPIVIVTGPGPGSGKLATCLGQLYHEYKRGIKAGYAKFETFPIWNLPLSHKVNLAYEAATVDLRDKNLIDSHHLEAYGITTVNYNRDIEAFPLVKKIIEKITGEPSFYKSPTDMGVNRAGYVILDDGVAQEAAHQEIVRRFLKSECDYAMGLIDEKSLQRSEMLMKRIDANVEDRKVVVPARHAALAAEVSGKGANNIFCGAAMELPDGTIITGKNSPLMHAGASLVLNAVKHLAGFPDQLLLLPENIISSLNYLKKEVLNRKMISLDVDETITALSISAISNPAAQMAVDKLKELRHCEVHLTHMPTPGDESGFRKLGVNLTSDPNFSSKSLFVY